MALAMTGGAISCSNDAYETGDSRYSYLRTDFVEMRTDANSQLNGATTDDDEALSFAKPVSVSWITTPDSTYRAMLTYNIGKTGGNESTANVEPLSVKQVYVLNPKAAKDSMTISTDPVHLQSVWESNNGSYFNLSVALMTGTADSEDTKQYIGLLCDSIETLRNGHAIYHYKLTHSQGGVPQYYRTTIYISIPTKKMTTGDVVRLSLNTYDGWVTKELII